MYSLVALILECLWLDAQLETLEHDVERAHCSDARRDLALICCRAREVLQHASTLRGRLREFDRIHQN